MENKKETLTAAEEQKRQQQFIEKARIYVREKSEELGRPLYACTTTFGCQMNARDSEKLDGILEAVGYIKTDKEDEADFVIYNTCTVRENANQRVYGRLGYLGSMKKKKPHMMIALCGCMMQEAHVVEKLKKSYRFVDLIFGTHNIFKFPELLCYAMESDRMIIDVWKDTDQIVEDLPVDRKYKFKSGVNIMFGCNNFCSYCIIPYVRGACRSKDFNKVIKEVKTLTENGYQEIVLTGIHTGNYGVDLKTNFANLLKELVKIEKLKRLRISSIEVTELNDAVLEVIKSNKVIVDHLHIPLQAGSDEILKAMNRKYNLDYYKNKIKQIRSIRPDISISTDIIVGFPGEDEKLFEQTLKTAQSIAFSKIHVFPYSIRKNTKAASMPNQVDGKIKKERAKRLIELSKELEIEYMNKFIGKTVEVLTENNKDGITYGHTGNFLHVKINKVLPNDLLKMVKITSVSYPYVIGELIDE